MVQKKDAFLCLHTSADWGGMTQFPAWGHPLSGATHLTPGKELGVMFRNNPPSLAWYFGTDNPFPKGVRCEGWARIRPGSYLTECRKHGLTTLSDDLVNASHPIKTRAREEYLPF